MAGAGSEARVSARRDVIDREELTQAAWSVYEAVRALRPRWLQGRAGATMASPVRQTPRVYLDGRLIGGVGALWDILPGSVKELRFLNAADATTRFGTNHLGGAILVTTR